LENNLMTYLFTEDQEIKNEVGNPISVSKNTTVNSPDNPLHVDISSTAVGAALQPWGLTIAQGLVPGHTYNHKFGAVAMMSQNTTGSIWDKDDTYYPWSAYGTGAVATILTTAANGSTSTLDDGESIRIEGLDENYEPASDTLTISGSTATGTQTFLRINRAYVIGNSSTNQTQIRISVNGTEVARIQINKAQTLMAVYTIPAGKTGYMMKLTSTCQYGADATIDFFRRYYGEPAFRIQHTAETSGAGGQYIYPFTFSVALPEKTDIDMRATVRSNNARVTAAFDILLVDNP
jgi:hypothetical protein